MVEYKDVYVLGVGMYPATLREHGRRLEEMVYSTSRRALDDAGVNRRQLDNVVLGASEDRKSTRLNSSHG